MPKKKKSPPPESDSNNVDLVITDSAGIEHTELNDALQDTDERSDFDIVMASVGQSAAAMAEVNTRIFFDKIGNLAEGIVLPEKSFAEFDKFNQAILPADMVVNFADKLGLPVSHLNDEFIKALNMALPDTITAESAKAMEALKASMSEEFANNYEDVFSNRTEVAHAMNSISEEFAKTYDEKLAKTYESMQKNDSYIVRGTGYDVIPRTDYDVIMDFPSLPSPQERLADEIAESNRLNREILEELKAQRLANTNRLATSQLESKTDMTPSVKSKRGRSQYSDNEKLEVVKWWDSLDPSTNAITLPEYLDAKFGSMSGILNVAESTFHSWRKYLKAKGLY